MYVQVVYSDCQVADQGADWCAKLVESMLGLQAPMAVMGARGARPPAKPLYQYPTLTLSRLDQSLAVSHTET
jgi:hypothetical protein